MPQPHLPTELLGKICADDAAVADSTPSLFALCLTSRTFRNLSQPHLYRNLDITHLPDPLEESGYALKRCSAALRETLGKRPQLARECRSLTLTFRTRAEGERFKSGSTPACEGFATLFELLCQVEVFKVNHDGTGRYPPAELDRALACMESWRNTLYRVKLHALSRDAMRFLLAKPHLEFLDVGQVARDCVPRAQSVAPFHLTALIYDDFAADAFLTLTSSSHASLVNLIAPFFFVGAGEEARANAIRFGELLGPFTSLAYLGIDFTLHALYDPNITQGYLNALTLFLAGNTRLVFLALVHRGSRPGTTLVDTMSGTMPRALKELALWPWFMTAEAALDMLAQVRQGHEDAWRWPPSLRTVTWTRSLADGESLSQGQCDAIQAACVGIGISDCRCQDETME